jgi:hypothetical protein
VEARDNEWVIRELIELKKIYPFADKFNMDSVWSAFEAISNHDKRYKVYFATYYADKNPEDEFQKWQPSGYSINRIQQEDFSYYKMKRVIKRSTQLMNREIQGVFGTTRLSDSIWLFFTSENPDFFKNGLVRFLDQYSPEITKIRLSSDNIREVLEKLEDVYDGDILIKKAILYSHRKEGEINYKKRTIYQLFSLAEKDECIVDKVEFILNVKNRYETSGFIARDGVVHYHGGKIQYIRGSLFNNLNNLSLDITKKLHTMQEKKSIGMLNSIDIVYKNDVFSNVSANHKLIKALTNFSRGGVAVYHSNPYLHAVVFDYIDGSAFDIFITGINKLTIIPSDKNSIHSSLRLCELVFRDFSEGEIQETPNVKYSITDFICTSLEA